MKDSSNLYFICANCINVLCKYPIQVRLDLKEFVKKFCKEFIYRDELIDKLYTRYLLMSGDDSAITIKLIHYLEKL